MISIIDAATERWVRVISVGDQSAPKDIAMMPDNQSLVVAMQGGNGTIRKYDASNSQSLGEFQSNINPGKVAITPDGTKGYITDDNYSGNQFCIFDPIAMKVNKIIASPYLIDPTSIAISPDGKFAYISGQGSDNVIRIDTKNDSVLRSLPLASDIPVPPPSGYNGRFLPKKVILSADGKTMYVSCYNSSEIVVFNLTNDSISARVPINHNPDGMALTPDGTELWTVLYGDSVVSVINTSTHQVIARIDSVSYLPNSISITPDGNYAYVSCDLSAGGAHHHATGGLPSSSYVVIDCKKRAILSIIELPPLSVGVTIGYK